MYKLRGRTFDQPLRTYATRLSDLLPWLDFVAPGVVLNDDQSLQATLALTNPDLRVQPKEQQASAMLQANIALQQLDLGWSLHSETQRLLMPIPAPVESWQHVIGQQIETEHRETSQQKPWLESRHYVTLRYAPPKPRLARLESLFLQEEDHTQVQGWQAYLLSFQTTVQRLAMLLSGIMREVTPLDDTATWNFYDSVMNLRWRAFVLPDETHYIAEQLDDDPEDFNGGSRPIRHGQYLRTVTIGKFPATSVALMLAKLNDLDVEYRWVSRWIPFDQEATEKSLQRQQEAQSFHKKAVFRQLLDRFWPGDESAGIRPMAEYNVAEVKKAQIELGTDAAAFGTYTVTVTVWDEDWLRSERKVLAVLSAIHSMGFKCVVEKTNATGALLGSFPGMVVPNPRTPTLNSINVSHLMPIDGVYCGQPRDERWQCGPLFIGTTAKSNPYRYVPHADQEAAAHTFFDGPSGSGKTVWKDNLRIWCQQVPDLQDIGFDVKAAGKTTTLMLNGRFDDLGKGDVILQPFRYVDRPHELEFWTEWMLQWAKDLRVPVDPYLFRMIRGTLTRLANLHESRRTISGFIEALVEKPQGHQVKFHREDERELKRIQHLRDRLRVALDPFRGGILDGQEDGLSLQRVHTFELETLLETPTIAPAVIRAVHYRVDQALDGRPTLLWHDEAQAIFKLVESVEALDKWTRRARDKNVMLVAGTQSIKDMLAHPLGQVFLDNCPNIIAFPNPAALSAQNIPLYESLGFNRQQIIDLAAATPRRQWMHKSPHGCRMVEYALEPYQATVCGRSGKQWHAIVDQVYSQSGPEMFPAAWAAHEGFPEQSRELRSWLEARYGMAAD